MLENQALRKMVPPGMKRQGKPLGGVIQIWTTRACDKSCFGCTQAANIRGPWGAITPEQFEVACKSLQNYWGIIGVFGGNPTLHPQFDELCRILREYIPKPRRGLWCNKFFGHGTVIRETFNPAVSNINVHLDQAAYQEVRASWPEVRVFGFDKDSRHPPPYIAMQDLIENESERWDLIANCDINQHWSAMVGVFRGELRGYFCEIAGAQAMLHQAEEAYPDYGVAVEPGWWKKDMIDFANQARHHCHACGVPLRARGELAQGDDGVELTTETHAGVYQPRGNRSVQVITNLDQLGDRRVGRVIDYLKNAELK